MGLQANYADTAPHKHDVAIRESGVSALLEEELARMRPIRLTTQCNGNSTHVVNYGIGVLSVQI